MEDSAKHGAEISGGLVSEIVRDRGHRQPHRELLQPEHKPALPSPNRERHAGVAKEKARKGTLAGAGFPAPAFERSIVVGPLTQFLHDTEDATVLPVGHDQRRLSDDRYAVEKKTGQTHFGETGINVPWNVDRYVQQFSTERIEVITDAFGWKRGRDGGRRKEAAKSDDSRIPHPVVDSSRDPYRAVWRRDPNALPCADRGDATDDRDERTSVVSVRAIRLGRFSSHATPAIGLWAVSGSGSIGRRLAPGWMSISSHRACALLVVSSLLVCLPRLMKEQEVDQPTRRTRGELVGASTPMRLPISCA
jgi:hypothetical protein